MRNRRQSLRWGRMLRRSSALALALTALWAVGLTRALPGPAQLAGALGSDPDFVVGLASSRLNFPSHNSAADGLDRWGRFLVEGSALLSGEFAQTEREEHAAGPLQPFYQGQEGDADDQQEQPLEPLPDGAVVEHTSLGKDDGSYLKDQALYLKNDTGLTVDLAGLAGRKAALKLGGAPQILIYHTHGSEAYTQTEDARYVESDAYRTTDCTRNVVRVGEDMAGVFREMGFEVVHDTTLYDYPAYSGAYERSRAGIGKWLEEYPAICLVLDVHRDALVGEDGAAYKFIAREEEGTAAQVMLVVGSSDSGAAHPNWKENLTLAVQVQLAMTRRYAQLARPITLRSTRFNQDTSPGALLVEVGGHGNTLEEALAGGRMFARTVGELLQEMQTEGNTGH